MSSNPTDVDVVLEQERLMEDAAELIAELMERTGKTQKDIAQQIGKSKGFVSQVLSGRRNMTLRTFSDLVASLGFRIALDATPLNEKRRYRNTSSVSEATTSAEYALGTITKTQHDVLAWNMPINLMPLMAPIDDPSASLRLIKSAHLMHDYRSFDAVCAKGYNRGGSGRKTYESVKS